MAVYYYTGGTETGSINGWIPFVSKASGSRDMYVSTGSGLSTRISNVYVWTGSQWTEVFAAYNSPPTSVPTLSFASTNADERDLAHLHWTASPGATGYQIWVNGVAYTETTGTSLAIPVSPNTNPASLTAYNFQVLAFNQYGSTSLSNTKRMVPGGVDVPWSALYSGGTQTFLADVTSSSNQNQGYIASLTFPNGKSNSSQAGYYRLDYFSVEIYPSNTSGMASPTSSSRSMGAKIGTNAIDFTNVIYNVTTTGGLYAWTKYESNLNLNSNNFGGQKIYWMVDGGGWTTSSSMSATYGYYARNFYLQGVTTTASTYS